MKSNINHVVNIYLTPDFLRKLADKAEKKWNLNSWGDDLEIGRFYSNGIQISFRIDQEKMRK